MVTLEDHIVGFNSYCHNTLLNTCFKLSSTILSDEINSRNYDLSSHFFVGITRASFFGSSRNIWIIILSYLSSGLKVLHGIILISSIASFVEIC